MEYFEPQHSTKAVRKFNPMNSLSLLYRASRFVRGFERDDFFSMPNAQKWAKIVIKYLRTGRP